MLCVAIIVLVRIIGVAVAVLSGPWACFPLYSSPHHQPVSRAECKQHPRRLSFNSLKTHCLQLSDVNRIEVMNISPSVADSSREHQSQAQPL